MALTITKSKPSVVEDVQLVELSPNAELIDEIGATSVRIEEILAMLLQKHPKEMAELKALEANLKKMAPKVADVLTHEALDRDPDGEVVLVGELYRASLGKAGNTREISDMEALHAILDAQKKGLFYELATIPLGKVDDYLTPAEREDVITSGRGRRPAKYGRRA